MRIDLQLHSTYSDGYLSPTELAALAAENKIKTAALTDHNTVGGTYEFRKACEKHGIKAITGIELYVKYNNYKLNILWYNLDETDPRLHNLLRDSQQRRRKQMRHILIKMKGLGFKLDVDSIIDSYNHYVPINRVIDDICAIPGNLKLIKKQLNQKIIRENDIIYEFFQNKKKPPVLQNSYININRILALRKKIGGQIILCHPGKDSKIDKNKWQKFKKIGFDGVEVMSPHHSYGAIMYIQQLAREFDFIETGGSDFHKPEGNNFPIQRSWDYFHINTRYLKGIEKIIG
jgi:3',5'-nucleoside bisphosphate phosphatase